MNINLDSSLRKNLSVHVVFILSKQDNIFFINVEDTTNIGIQEGIQ